MRVEPGQHSADRGLDQLGVVRLLDVVGAYALEHVAEQIKLVIGIRHRRLSTRDGKGHMRLRSEQCHRRSCRRAE